jgi:diadenosine tetraphosphate (Ap4A) HIT family hydrolase
MPTLFSKIITGEIPGTFVWRDDQCVAFLSINPLAPGHALVVPIAEVDHWIDAPPELNARLFTVAQIIGQAQQQAFACERVGVIVAGYEIPHLHVHVIPTSSMSQLNFSNAGTTTPADLEAAAELIRIQLRTAGHAEVA